jgi:DNA-binding transcriptional MerR regulator/effector-binding domain-containing protein
VSEATIRGKSKYNIGEVAGISGLSIKALRYYDQKGILTPQTRNGQTNYRYYSEDQILRALTISALKARGFSIDEMETILNANTLAKVTEYFAKHTATIQDEIEKLESEMALVEESRNIILKALHDAQGTDVPRGADEPEFTVTVSEMEKRQYVYTRYRSRIIVKEIFWDRFAHIERIQCENSYVPDGPITAVFHEHYTHQFFFDEGDLEVLQPIVSAPDSEYTKIFGGFTVASHIHVGHYSDMLTDYIALIKWIEANNYAVDGDPIEEYLVEYTHGVAPSGYVTRISFPIRKA